MVYHAGLELELHRTLHHREWGARTTVRDASNTGPERFALQRLMQSAPLSASRSTPHSILSNSLSSIGELRTLSRISQAQAQVSIGGARA